MSVIEDETDKINEYILDRLKSDKMSDIISNLKDYIEDAVRDAISEDDYERAKNEELDDIVVHGMEDEIVSEYGIQDAINDFPEQSVASMACQIINDDLESYDSVIDSIVEEIEDKLDEL